MATVKTKGIDVSYWQGKPFGYRYGDAKKAGWDFIIARIGYASNGIRYPDSTFGYNYDMAVKYGLKIGTYFYSNAKNAADGKREAEYVLQLLQERSLNFPIWIDMEDNSTSGKASKANLAAACKAFCETIEEAGYMSGVYASLSWFNSKIGNLGALRKWVAQYNSTLSYKGDCDIWQYTDAAKVGTFPGKRDGNKCYVTYNDNFLIIPKVDLLIRKGSSLTSSKIGALSKGGIYRVTKVSGNRGYVMGHGWITATSKFVDTIQFNNSIKIRTKGKLITRSGAPLSSKKKTTLYKDKIYTVTAINQDGTRGKTSKGWITITPKYVDLIC